MTKKAPKTDDSSVIDEIKFIIIVGFSLCYSLAIGCAISCFMESDLCGASTDISSPDSMGPE